MTPSDVLRVREARRRLREVIRDIPRADPAIRIVELESPRSGGVPLSLHPDFSVIAGLSVRGHDEVVATIDALHRGSPNAGLSGTIIVEGAGVPLHDPNITAVVEPEPPFFNDLEFDVTWTDNSELNELVEAIEAAVLVTSAELRGADATMNKLRAVDIDQPEVIDLRTTDADREEIRRTLEALNAIEPDESAIAVLAERLERLSSAPSSVSLQATVEQYSAALERLQPTDPEHVRVNLEKALDDAVEAQNAAERMRRTEAYGVVDLLATLGVDSSPETAPDIAQTGDRRAFRVGGNSRSPQRETSCTEATTPTDDQLTGIGCDHPSLGGSATQTSNATTCPDRGPPAPSRNAWTEATRVDDQRGDRADERPPPGTPDPAGRTVGRSACTPRRGDLVHPAPYERATSGHLHLGE